MGICRFFCINKTGRTVQVNDVDRGNVGALNNRESYALYGTEGSLQGITFLGPNGGLVSAHIDADAAGIENYHTCLDYPYGTEIIDDVLYSTFIMRKSMPIYKRDGSRWGTVAANMLVATDTATVGDSHPNWKEIKYVQKSPTREWIKVESDSTHKYGFVDTGLASGSGYSKIAFYGSW